MSARSRMRPTFGRGVAALALAMMSGAVMPAAAGPAPTGRYAVEFRARAGGIFGHTYVAFGRLDRHGGLVAPRYAGFYPSGALTDTPLLAVLAAPGFVNLKPRDRSVRSDLVFRREISADAYARLPAAIRALRRARPLWHLTLYNCNSFAADVAESVGLRTPPTLEIPKDFVRDLFVMNDRGR